MTKTNFQLVAAMNAAFGNPKGDALNIDWEKVRNQSKNVLDEFGELMIGLGAAPEVIRSMVKAFKSSLAFPNHPNLPAVRDAASDIHVFDYGIHHFLGIDADADMEEVVYKVMTRFIKNEADKAASIAKHAALGVTDVYFEGEYPTMVMKSASDQPDAPKGKFLKSASYTEPVFAAPSIDKRADYFGDGGNAEARMMLDAHNASMAEATVKDRLRQAAARAAADLPDCN
jgi:hypothetical protein